MTRSSIVKAIIGLAALLALAGCSSASLGDLGASHAFMSWDEFYASAYQRPDGVYIIDGDLPVQDLADLRDIYDRAAAAYPYDDYILAHDRTGVTTPESDVFAGVPGWAGL